MTGFGVPVDISQVQRKHLKSQQQQQQRQQQRQQQKQKSSWNHAKCTVKMTFWTLFFGGFDLKNSDIRLKYEKVHSCQSVPLSSRMFHLVEEADVSSSGCTKPLSTIQCNKTLCRDQLVPILLIG